MLTDGFNHVAVLTKDSARLHAFYEEVFEAVVLRDSPEVPEEAGLRLSIVNVGPHSELNVFEIEGNDEADRQTPMFGRGRIDHLGLQASSKEAFDAIRDRLIACGAIPARRGSRRDRRRAPAAGGASRRPACPRA